MKRILWVLFFLVTATGAVLPFLPAGSWPWWDPLWVALFFIAVYYDFASSSGLSRARFSSGIVVIAMAVILGLSGMTGWPIGPLRFTTHAGLQLGGSVPLILPLLAYAILSTCNMAAASAFPWSGRKVLAAATALAFLLTVINGCAFASLSRLWWEWNPTRMPDASGRAVIGLAFLSASAFALAFVYPVDSRLRMSRWNPGAFAWLAGNTLFLVANLAIFLS